MKNSFSLQQIQKTINFDANLSSRQYKLNLMADFMRVKYENPKMRQSQIPNQLGLSSSTLQRYRNDINMLSPYRIKPINTNKLAKKAKNTNSNNDSQPNYDDKRPQLTSKQTQTNQLKIKKKQIERCGIIEINEHYLDEILKNNNS